MVVPFLYTLVLVVVLFGLIVPLCLYVHPLAGSLIGWVVFIGILFAIAKFLQSVQTDTLTEWEHVRLPGVLRILDMYLFICLGVSMMWFTLWVLDRENALIFPFVYNDGVSPYFVFLAILYSVSSSWWLIGNRVSPASTIAYVWGFAVLLGSVWFTIVFIGWTLKVIQRTAASASSSSLTHGEGSGSTVLPIFQPAYHHSMQQRPVTVATVPLPLTAKKGKPSIASINQFYRQFAPVIDTHGDNNKTKDV